MNPAAVQVHLLKMGRLLNALLSEELSPETRVLAREAAASVFTTSQLAVDVVIRSVLNEPAERDKPKG